MSDRVLPRRVHALVDGWWDPDRRLLTTPSGRHDRGRSDRGEFGLLPPTVWWAHGLLRRGAPGDRQLAQQALRGVLDRQYDAPGQPWDGTWPAVAEEPAPQPGAVAFSDYDPNWRAFVGSALALVGLDHPTALQGGLAGRIATATARAARSDDDHRVPPQWTNVAVLRAWLDLHVGHRDDDGRLVARGTALATAVHDDTVRRGQVAERGSPTYAGITLLGLSLWAERAPVPWLADVGAELRDRVWKDLLQSWHPRLRTLAPPLSRAYALDMREHVGATAPWLAWLLGGTPALPPLDGGTLHQGHDLPIALLVPALAGAGERTLALAEQAALRPLRRGAWTDVFGNRTWSGWTGRTLAVGAERSPEQRGGWWQHVGAAAIWQAAGFGTAWLRVHLDDGPVVADVVEEAGHVVLRVPVAHTGLRLLVGGVDGPDEVSVDRLVVAGRGFALRGVRELVPVRPTTVPDGRWEAQVVLDGDLLELRTPVG